ncbi:hypothetical protein H7U22_18240, partial [Pedobacter sp. CCM 8938]
MKTRFTYLLFLLTFSTLIGIGNMAVAALNVTATGTNGTCASDASITATATGNTGVVNYQLLQGSTVIRNYQASNIFSNLPAGSYIVKVQDATTTVTAQSGTVTLTTTYVAMVISIPTYQVGCTTATNGQLTVTVTKGKAPYNYSISPDPNSVGVQSSNTFNNLTVGSYTISITDACGVTVTQSSSVYSTSTTVNQIQPPFGGAYFAWGNFQNGEYNDCSKGAFVNTYGWTYKATNGGLAAFDLQHFYWRYEYPSGSGNVYGAGGVLNGANVPLSTRSIPAPATATYPFGNGDIIIYDECGNSFRTPNSLWQSTATSSPQQGTGNRATAIYDCNLGGGVNAQVMPYETICFPVTYTFIDQVTGTIITQTINNNTLNYYYGFVPGHAYSVTALDVLGHNATQTSSVTIPTSVGSIVSGAINNGNNYPNSSILAVYYPVQIAANTAVSYTVTASSTGNPAVGYTKSFTYTSATQINGVFSGPNPDGTWPNGTYTVQVNSAPCIVNSSYTFTVASGFSGKLNGNYTATVPNCGVFSATLQANLNNSSLYQVKIISGPSNVGVLRGFNSTAVSSGVYNSLSFDGLNYGTYVFGLYPVGSTTTPLYTQSITYNASNTLTIDALSTGGYVCAGSPTGSLSVTATSASGSALEYSKDGGTTWQSANVFNGLAVGNYPVVVRDICGNTATYTASVVQASGISASASTNPVCAGSSTQLSVNAIGATSYAWTGPNGFTSSLQNPIISNMQSVNAGIYSVTVTSPSCTNVASVTVGVNPLPVATISYSSSSFCATGNISSTISGTTGGTFSSTTGLSISAATGDINLATSASGTYTVTYSFSNSGTGCSNTTTTTVKVNALPLVVTHNQSNCAPSTVDLTATAVTLGSTTGLTYTYFTESSGTTVLNNPNAVASSGTYYIKGYLASTGCYSAVTPVAVTIQPQPTVVVTNPASVCAPSKIDLTAAAVTGGSSANLSFAYYTNAGTTTVLSSPSAVANSGTYYIQGTNTITGCVSVAMPVTVTVNPLPNAPAVAITQPVCGTPTGSITITGVTGETYSFDGGAYSSTLTYRGLAPGSHSVIAKGMGSCTSTATNITISPAKITSNAPTVAVTAQPVCGTPTGSISITAVTGETYSVDGGTYSATLTYAGLVPGAHSILAKSSDGCISSATNILINPAKAVASTPVFAVTQPVCGTPTGSISITAVTGQKYSIDGGAFTATLIYSALTPGAHTVTSQSVDACNSAAMPFTITPAKVVATTPVFALTQPTCGTPTGSINITAVTGEKYSIDGGTFTATTTYASLTPGAHTVTSQSVDGCNSAAVPFTISPAKAIANAPVFAVAQPVCETPTGSISITAVTGEKYSVDGGAFTETTTYASLTPGSHTVTSQSVDGCSSAAVPFTISPAKVVATTPVFALTQSTCGTPTGSINITAVTGEKYSIDGGTFTATTTYASLTPGAHTVTSQSVDGCNSAAVPFTISPAKAVANAPVFAVTQPVCGTPTGSISITAVTGEKYSVDGGAFTAATTYASLTPGSHTVTSQSVDGCSSAAMPFTISPAKATATTPVFAVTQPVCGTPTGTINITGVAGEKYSIDGGAFTATTTYALLTPGAHTVTSQSVDGCSSAAVPFTISPAKVVANAPVFAVAQPVCGTPTGSISITSVTGEKYSVDGGTYSATTTYASLTPGSHTVTSQSVDGCSSAATPFTISPAKAVASTPVFAITQPVCGTPTGSISITAVTGEKYSVDGGAFTAATTYASLTPGSHTVTSQSVDGCNSAAVPFTISPAKAVANAPVFAVAQPVCGTPTGSISITAVTGEKYSVDGGAFTATTTYASLTPGAHTVTSQSVDGCSSAATPFTISPAKAIANTPVFAVTQPVCGTPTGSISITAVAGEKYSVDGGAFTAALVYSGLTANASHTITSQSIDGCTATKTVAINAAKVEANAPTVSVSAQPVCGTPTGSI